jgi:hypothetical protein
MSSLLQPRARVESSELSHCRHSGEQMLPGEATFCEPTEDFLGAEEHLLYNSIKLNNPRTEHRDEDTWPSSRLLIVLLSRPSPSPVDRRPVLVVSSCFSS